MLVNVCVCTHMCICDSFCGYNSGLLCINSYIDFFLEPCQNVLTQVISTNKPSAISVFRVQANSEKALTSVVQLESKAFLMLQME